MHGKGGAKMRAKASVKATPIDKGQIKRIHVLASRLELPDPLYRKWLDERYGVASSKQLTAKQAEEFIRTLEHFGTQAGYWDRNPNKDKYNELAGRPGMATPAQMRMVESIWTELTRPANDEQRNASLRGFLFKYFKISDLRFLSGSAVNKAILALKAMKTRKWEGSPKSLEDARGGH
jgi:hypothetical protein